MPTPVHSFFPFTLSSVGKSPDSHHVATNPNKGSDETAFFGVA